MEAIELRRGPLSVRVSPHGAELVSLCHDAVGELIWQPREGLWSQCAPWLFPVIGHMPDTIKVEGASLSMPLHGFAQHCLFRVRKQSDAACAMQLSGTSETKEIYPFDFDLIMRFELDESGLDIAVDVKNPSSAIELPFMFGGHPGFTFPLPGAGPKEDHSIRFSERQKTKTIVVDGDRGAAARCASFDGLTLAPASMDFAGFSQGLVPFSGGLTTFGTNAVNIAMRIAGFKNLAFWREVGAPYFCIEPWSNLPIHSPEPASFQTLSGIEFLPPGARRSFRIHMAVAGQRLN